MLVRQKEEDSASIVKLQRWLEIGDAALSKPSDKTKRSP
jgi:hypothetical protein